MAIKIFEKYGPRANPADADYPHGSIKNESVPGANDGTPLEAAWANDYAGADAALFAETGIEPNGQPDTVGNSQRVEAIKLLDKEADKVTNANGGSVQDFIDSLANHDKGAAMVARSSVTVQSLEELAELPKSQKLSAQLQLGMRSGIFRWNPNDVSTQVEMDTLQGRFVAPSSDGSGESGAWERVFSDVAHPSMWGGGTTVDDTQAVIQSAWLIPESTRLVFEREYTLTSEVPLPPVCRMDMQVAPLLNGDMDHWFTSEAGATIDILNFRARQTPASRTLTNRFAQFRNPYLVTIGRVETHGSGTAVHCLGGDTFICGDCYVYDTVGTSAQSGYGINSSARITRLGNVYGINESEGNGRHLIYINGGAWEDVNIGDVYCKNFSHNPLNLVNTNLAAVAKIEVGNVYMESCNTHPTTNSTGAVHFPEPQSPGIVALIGDITLVDGAGSALSSAGTGVDNIFAGDVRVIAPRPALFNNDFLIHIRGSANCNIRSLWASELPANYLAAVRFRECTGGGIGQVTIGGNTGVSAISLLNSSGVSIGGIRATIPHIVSTGSTFYRRLENTDTWFDFGASSTPSVRGRKNIHNGATVTVTNFSDGEDGQEIVVEANTGSITMIHGTNIFNTSGGDLVLNIRQAARYIKRGSYWIQA